MSTQTDLPQMPTGSPEARPQSRPAALPKDTKAIGPQVYWGYRLTLNFWLFCFGLLLAMELVEAIHRFVLFVMDRSLVP